MRTLIEAGLATLAMTLLAAQDAGAASYSLRALAPLGASHTSQAHVLTPSGLALGESTVTQRCPVSQWVACLVDGHTDKQPRAVYWADMQPAPQYLRCLDTTLAPNATWDLPCEATGANSKGVMVGRSYAGFSAEGRHRPVMWPRAGGPAVDLTHHLEGLPAHDSARAIGINDQGWILGRARLKGGTSEYAFLLRDGLPLVLPNAGAASVRPVAIQGGMAIGEGRFEGGGQSGVVIWHLDGGATTVRSIASQTDHVYASSLSAAGHVTGAYWSTGHGRTMQAYVWHQGQAQPLQTDAGHDSRGHGVNAAGQVVGTHCAAGQDMRGCRASLWTHGVRQDLNTLTQPPAGHVLVDARSINDQGRIAGWMLTPAGHMQGFLLTPMPTR